MLLLWAPHQWWSSQSRRRFRQLTLKNAASAVPLMQRRQKAATACFDWSSEEGFGSDRQY